MCLYIVWTLHRFNVINEETFLDVCAFAFFSVFFQYLRAFLELFNTKYVNYLGEQDESVCKSYITQIKDLRLRLEGCENRTVNRLRQMVDKEPLKACSQRATEQKVCINTVLIYIIPLNPSRNAFKCIYTTWRARACLLHNFFLFN